MAKEKFTLKSNNKNLKMYLVSYLGGDYDDYFEINVFVTDDEEYAKKYASKFNTILKKWKEYYSKYEEQRYGETMTWIKDEYVEKYFYRWNAIRSIDVCVYTEIQFRN